MAKSCWKFDYVSVGGLVGMDFVNSSAIFLFLCAIALAAEQPCRLCDSVNASGVPINKFPEVSQLFVLGNSLEDVGNLAAFLGKNLYGNASQVCGRYSNGAILVDFLARGFGLSTTEPYLACPCGTNFAVAGATALGLGYFQKQGLQVIVPFSFDNESKAFTDYRKTCSSKFLDKALFIVGGGANDYNIPVFGQQTPSQIIQSVDLVVNKVVDTVQFLVNNGATQVWVLNIPQPSCTPLYLDALRDPEGVDQFGCLKAYGRIAETHNSRLLSALCTRLQVPEGVMIKVLDRLSFQHDVFREPRKYGFVNTDDACCGGGGQHNGLVNCGEPNSTTCSNPNQFVFFDRVHFTENFNRQQALAVLQSNSKYLYTIRPK